MWELSSIEGHGVELLSWIVFASVVYLADFLVNKRVNHFFFGGAPRVNVSPLQESYTVNPAAAFEVAGQDCPPNFFFDLQYLG